MGSSHTLLPSFLTEAAGWLTFESGKGISLAKVGSSVMVSRLHKEETDLHIEICLASESKKQIIINEPFLNIYTTNIILVAKCCQSFTPTL